MQFVRAYAKRIVIGAALAAAVFGALLVWMPYPREQRIGRRISAVGGHYATDFSGPSWLEYVPHPQPFFFLERITVVWLGQGCDPLSLGSPRNYQYMQVTDIDLEPLRELSQLSEIDLLNTRVTDLGLLHLSGLANLRELNLEGTQTTSDGRATLRKALPNWSITPNP